MNDRLGTSWGLLIGLGCVTRKKYLNILHIWQHIDCRQERISELMWTHTYTQIIRLLFFCPSLHRLIKYESSQAHVKCYQFMPYCAFSNAILKYGIYYAIVYICDVYCFCMNDYETQVRDWDYFDHAGSYVAMCGQSDFFFFFSGKWSCRHCDWMDATAVNKIFFNFLFEILCVLALQTFKTHTCHTTLKSVPVNSRNHIWRLLHQLPSVCIIKHIHTHMIATSEPCWTEPVSKVCGFRSDPAGKSFAWWNHLQVWKRGELVT